VKPDELRVGFGYDIHRLERGRPLILGGVRLDHDMGLSGHSDADVVTHAIIDALLGAAGLPDIGHQFPNTDPCWKDASSLDMLSRVRSLLHEAEWRPINIDATLVAEAPKIGPHVTAMSGALAAALGIPSADVGIKATTAEGLGPEGIGQAMSARAIALLARDPAKV
jgi:2-C-methyl-D-erythritol 2,4-cyclodiphosphate synthase